MAQSDGTSEIPETVTIDFRCEGAEHTRTFKDNATISDFANMVLEDFKICHGNLRIWHNKGCLRAPFVRDPPITVKQFVGQRLRLTGPTSAEMAYMIVAERQFQKGEIGPEPDTFDWKDYRARTKKLPSFSIRRPRRHANDVQLPLLPASWQAQSQQDATRQANEPCTDPRHRNCNCCHINNLPVPYHHFVFRRGIELFFERGDAPVFVCDHTADGKYHSGSETCECIKTFVFKWFGLVWSINELMEWVYGQIHISHQQRHTDMSANNAIDLSDHPVVGRAQLRLLHRLTSSCRVRNKQFSVENSRGAGSWRKIWNYLFGEIMLIIDSVGIKTEKEKLPLKDRDWVDGVVYGAFPPAIARKLDSMMLLVKMIQIDKCMANVILAPNLPRTKEMKPDGFWKEMQRMLVDGSVSWEDFDVHEHPYPR